MVDDTKFMNELLTPQEVKEELKISLGSTYRLINKEDFPLIRLGGKMLIRRNDLFQYLETYKKKKEA